MSTNVNKFLGFRVFLRDFVWCLRLFFRWLCFYWRIDMGFPVTISLERDNDNDNDLTLF